MNDDDNYVACVNDDDPDNETSDCDEDYDYEGERYDDDYDGYLDNCEFADPGGRSALRAATEDNPRNLPCPSCRRPNRLTPKDKKLEYICDTCADTVESGGF